MIYTYVIYSYIHINDECYIRISMSNVNGALYTYIYIILNLHNPPFTFETPNSK